MLMEGSRHRALLPREARKEGASSRAERAKGGNNKRDQAQPGPKRPIISGSGALHRGVRRETNTMRLVRMHVRGAADVQRLHINQCE